MKVEAVVLAGATNDGKLSEVSDERYEALIPIGKRPMVHYVLDALARSKSVKRIIVVGPVEALKSSGIGDDVDLVEGVGSMVENLEAGIERVQSNDPVLIVTSDIPLIGPEAIDAFVASCEKIQADIYYPIVSRQVSEARFPDVKRTYVTLKDGTFTGGNLALIRPAVVPACHTMIAQAVAMRKKPVKLSRLLGLKFIIKLMFRRLTMAEIEDRVQRILGFRGVGIISTYPEVGIDVDKPEDLQLVVSALERSE